MRKNIQWLDFTKVVFNSAYASHIFFLLLYKCDIYDYLIIFYIPLNDK